MDVNVDMADRPLIRIELGEAPSPEAFAQMFTTLGVELHGGDPVCLLVDARSCKRMTIAHVRLFADFGKTNRELVSKKILALAMVIPSAMVRGALKAALRLDTPPHPAEVFHRMDEALANLHRYLDADSHP